MVRDCVRPLPQVNNLRYRHKRGPRARIFPGSAGDPALFSYREGDEIMGQLAHQVKTFILAQFPVCAAGVRPNILLGSN
jgi:hypothetical protein